MLTKMTAILASTLGLGMAQPALARAAEPSPIEAQVSVAIFNTSDQKITMSCQEAKPTEADAATGSRSFLAEIGPKVRGTSSVPRGCMVTFTVAQDGSVPVVVHSFLAGDNHEQARRIIFDGTGTSIGILESINGLAAKLDAQVLPEPAARITEFAALMIKPQVEGAVLQGGRSVVQGEGVGQPQALVVGGATEPHKAKIVPSPN